MVRDMKQALGWWLRAARQGNAHSQYNLGVIYAVGVDSVPRDIFKAAHWWHQAAIGGDPMAQYNLGALYANGETGEPDMCEAMHWWRKSKQNGFKQALTALHIVEQQIDSRCCDGLFRICIDSQCDAASSRH